MQDKSAPTKPDSKSLNLPAVLERRIGRDRDFARLIRAGVPPTVENYRLAAGYDELPEEWDAPPRSGTPGPDLSSTEVKQIGSPHVHLRYTHRRRSLELRKAFTLG
jgi:hypothetical protein